MYICINFLETTFFYICLYRCVETIRKLDSKCIRHYTLISSSRSKSARQAGTNKRLLVTRHPQKLGPSLPTATIPVLVYMRHTTNLVLDVTRGVIVCSATKTDRQTGRKLSQVLDPSHLEMSNNVVCVQ